PVRSYICQPIATAAIWLENRDRLRESRNSRNDRCVSRSRAPQGLIEDMIDRWPTPAALSMVTTSWPALHLQARHCHTQRTRGLRDNAATAIGVRRGDASGDRLGVW